MLAYLNTIKFGEKFPGVIQSLFIRRHNYIVAQLKAYATPSKKMGSRDRLPVLA